MVVVVGRPLLGLGERRSEEDPGVLGRGGRHSVGARHAAYVPDEGESRIGNMQGCAKSFFSKLVARNNPLNLPNLVHISNFISSLTSSITLTLN